MKFFLLILIFLSTSCYCEQLLGGWSISTDDSLKQDCLKLALNDMYGAEVNIDALTQVSNSVCKTQIVNGMNIKCTFTLRDQNWQCSYYKSFVQTLNLQLEQCKIIEKEPVATEVNDEEVVASSVTQVNEEQELEEVPVVNAQEVEDQEEDDEGKIDAMKEQMSERNANHEGEEQQQ